MANVKVAVVLALLGILLVFLLAGPVFTIWSLNTLFGLQIPYTFQTWCAVVWLITIIHGIKISLKKDN